MLPFWTSFLIRVYAWINILQRDGLLNQALLRARPHRCSRCTWLATDTAVYIGIVYSYLPFMVLPLYASLEKMDDSLLEAAADLGCPRWKAFWLVTLPLSLPGVVAGALLCFIPIVGEFVIPDLLGGSDTADDRPDAVDRILRQQGLAGRLRGRRACCCCCWSVPIAIYQQLQTRAIGRALTMRAALAAPTSPRSRSASPSSTCRS